MSEVKEVTFVVAKERENYLAGFLIRAFEARACKKYGTSIGYSVRFPNDITRLFVLVVRTSSEGCFRWLVAKYSYYPLWRIIAGMMRPLDFEILDDGFFVYIADIVKELLESPQHQSTTMSQRGSEQSSTDRNQFPDDHGMLRDACEWATSSLESNHLTMTERKHSRLKLSNGPWVVAVFFGLDWDKYQKGFASQKDACEWITQSLHFQRSAFRIANSNGGNCGPAPKLMSYFLTQWLPKFPDDALILRSSLESTCQILRYFNKRFQYDQMIYDHKCLPMWRRIEPLLPRKGRKQLVKALKTMAFWDGRALALHSKPKRKQHWTSATVVEYIPPNLASDKDFVGNVVLPWVSLHWQEAVRLYKIRNG